MNDVDPPDRAGYPARDAFETAVSLTPRVNLHTDPTDVAVATLVAGERRQVVTTERKLSTASRSSRCSRDPVRR
jgi:hypothetical protein